MKTSKKLRENPDLLKVQCQNGWVCFTHCFVSARKSFYSCGIILQVESSWIKALM